MSAQAEVAILPRFFFRVPSSQKLFFVCRAARHARIHLQPAHRLWTPLPNPTTYATKIGAKGTGRLIFDKIGSISTTPKRWLSEPKTKKSSQAAHVQYVVRRLTCIVSEVFFFFLLGAAPACPPGGAEASGEPEAVRRRDGGVHAPGEAKQNAVSLHSEMLRIIVPFGADCKEIMQSSPWLVTPGCVCVTPGAVCCYIRRHPCI